MNCSCFTAKNHDLAARGYKIAGVCTMFVITGNSFDAVHGLPLEKKDGSRMKKADPKMLQISFCPFCGNPCGGAR